MPFIACNCPNCNAKLNYDDSKKMMYCAYCGSLVKYTKENSENDADTYFSRWVNYVCAYVCGEHNFIDKNVSYQFTNKYYDDKRVKVVEEYLGVMSFKIWGYLPPTDYETIRKECESESGSGYGNKELDKIDDVLAVFKSSIEQYVNREEEKCMLIGLYNELKLHLEMYKNKMVEYEKVYAIAVKDVIRANEEWRIKFAQDREREKANWVSRNSLRRKRKNE